VRQRHQRGHPALIATPHATSRHQSRAARIHRAIRTSSKAIFPEMCVSRFREPRTLQSGFSLHPRGHTHAGVVEFRRDLEDYSDELKAKTGGVAPEEPA